MKSSRRLTTVTTTPSTARRWASAASRATSIVFRFLATIALVTPCKVLVLASRADPVTFSGLTSPLAAPAWSSSIVISWRAIVISAVAPTIS